jgi:hypothetical protein
MFFIKSDANAGLELTTFSWLINRGSVLGGDGDFLILRINTTFDLSPFY